ncbi:MAG: 4-alpha-glucanotransferase [Rhodocyclaceae bacterium]|nr:4-alpha-glucanotransferase [Rhodocyclaceae bacterium]MDZ4213700.1 4-alpha-glucanotransferase [Rhodocyclaceae bacterium]
MTEALQALADYCGIDHAYCDALGNAHVTSDAVRIALLVAMHLPSAQVRNDPAGLLAKLQQRPAPQPISCATATCYQPTQGDRVWGISVQLYGVRSRRNWGIGDFTDLAQLLEFTAAAGGDFVGVNPLHALFPDNPLHISPYSPSHRSFLNTLYIDVDAVPDLANCAEAQRRLASADFLAQREKLRACERVDYVGVAAQKDAILSLLFRHQTDERQQAFATWRTTQGEALEQLARFETLQAHFHAQDENIWGWPLWPVAYHDPHSAAVAAFAAAHAEAIHYRAWLQWLADEQLASAAERGRRAGLRIGIYLDLAIGANPGGAESWRWSAVFANGAHTGAPPDEINAVGQDWGLPPFTPERLRDVGYAPLIEVLQANMQHAGALRIDHVMGLQRLFWVPSGMKATDGAYVQYPFADMLGIVIEESQRNQCLVIGEDLGTVPEGFRDRMATAGVLSYHPMIFERYPDGNFRLPAEIAPQALVAVSTHDLPTLRGFWSGLDLDIREKLALFPNDALYPQLVTERGWDRGRLLWALQRENLLPADVDNDPSLMPEMSTATVAAVHAYLARSPSQLLVIQAEDLLGVLDQANLPGTLEDKHPNWQQRLPVDLEDWATHERCQAVLAAVRSERN